MPPDAVFALVCETFEAKESQNFSSIALAGYFMNESIAVSMCVFSDAMQPSVYSLHFIISRHPITLPYAMQISTPPTSPLLYSWIRFCICNYIRLGVLIAFFTMLIHLFLIFCCINHCATLLTDSLLFSLSCCSILRHFHTDMNLLACYQTLCWHAGQHSASRTLEKGSRSPSGSKS